MAADHGERIRIEDCAKRVRVYLGGVPVADSRRTKLVWEIPSYPTYYFPAADVDAGALVATDRRSHSPSRGDAHYFTVRAGSKAAEDAAWRYPDSPVKELQGLVRFEWGAMDAWFEEDEEVYVHARSPYTRVDILASSRHVRVELNGVTVADSHRPRLLFETGLPTRYYLPPTDVRLERLRPSDRMTACPYKGVANYWSVETGGDGGGLAEDIAWVYRSPLPESQKIAGLIAFYNERVDLYVDGELQARPQPRAPLPTQTRMPPRP